MFNYYKKLFMLTLRSEQMGQHEGGAAAPDTTVIPTPIEVDNITTEELNARLKALDEGKQKVEGDTKEKVGKLFVDMLTESGMTLDNKDALDSLIKKFKSFGYSVENNDALTLAFEYIPKLIQNNSSIRINGTVSGKKIILGIDTTPWDNDELEVIRQHTITENLPVDFSELFIQKDSVTTENEQSYTEGASQAAEKLRLARIRGLIKRYKDGNYEGDKVVKELYDKYVNVKGKTTSEQMDSFEKAINTVDDINEDKATKKVEADKKAASDKKAAEKKAAAEVAKKLAEDKENGLYDADYLQVIKDLKSKPSWGDTLPVEAGKRSNEIIHKGVLGKIKTTTSIPVTLDGKKLHITLNEDQVKEYNKIVDEKNQKNIDRKAKEAAEPSFLDNLGDMFSSKEGRESSQFSIATKEEFAELMKQLDSKTEYSDENLNVLGKYTENSSFRVKVQNGEYKSVRLDESQLDTYKKLVDQKNQKNTDRKAKEAEEPSLFNKLGDMFSSKETTQRATATEEQFSDILEREINSKTPKQLKGKQLIKLDTKGGSTHNIYDGKKYIGKVQFNLDQKKRYNTALEEAQK